LALELAKSTRVKPTISELLSCLRIAVEENDPKEVQLAFKGGLINDDIVFSRQRFTEFKERLLFKD
jgi:hypothetical protein